MSVIQKLPQPEAKFDLYFLAYDSPNALSHSNHWSDRQGISKSFPVLFCP